MCQNCDRLEEKKKQIIAGVEKTKPSCLVCESPYATGIGTWIAGKDHRLAVGDHDGMVSVFGFWLCNRHMELTPENEKIITQIILQEVSRGKPQQI